MVRKFPMRYATREDVYTEQTQHESLVSDFGRVVATVCYIFSESTNDVLLIHRNKKMVDPMKDMYIGLGGKCESFESPLECVVREVNEEVGLSISPDYCGFGTYVDDRGGPTWEVHYFNAKIPENANLVCDEGTPDWYSLDTAKDIIPEHDVYTFDAICTKKMIFPKFRRNGNEFRQDS
ncbi:MAG: NUDIX domain-containing protein, partial [Candidatus Woesearchaeota archaeon]